MIHDHMQNSIFLYRKAEKCVTLSIQIVRMRQMTNIR